MILGDGQLGMTGTGVKRSEVSAELKAFKNCEK